MSKNAAAVRPCDIDENDVEKICGNCTGCDVNCDRTGHITTENTRCNVKHGFEATLVAINRIKQLKKDMLTKAIEAEKGCK